MALKKSDKIIAIAGVLILIIAAISIALYPTGEEVKEVAPEEKTFYVTWNEETGGQTPIKDYVGKKETYTKPINVIAPANGLVSVLTHVKIQLTWEDDHTYGLLIKRGFDTLTASIYPTGSKSGKSDVTVGQGNSSFEFDINSVPNVDQVTSTDLDKASSIIKENFINKDKASFNTDISVKIGEKPRRLLKFLKDKGNGFDLTITYTYSYAEITESEVPPLEEPPATAHEAFMFTNLVHF